MNSPVIWNGNAGKLLAAQLFVPDGSVSAPSMAFTNDTGSGFYRIGTNNIALTVNGQKAMDVKYIAASTVNFGFGTTPNASNTVPITYDRPVNTAVFYQYGNSSTGINSQTVFQIVNGSGSNYTTIENCNSLTTGYMAGGTGFFGGINQLFTVLGSEYSAGNIRFTVGGRTTATERMRLNTTDLTLNAGISLKQTGATSGVLTRAVPSTVSSYTMTEPAQQGTANTFLKNSDGAGAMVWSHAPNAKNYISNCDFENATTTGWSLGTTGTLTNGLPTGSPTFGSGAAGTASLTGAGSGQLSGLFSLNFGDSAATTAGNMFATSAITLDIADQAKVLGFRFYYKAVSGGSSCNWSGTSSNSFAVAVYDVTNSVWLPTIGAFSMTQSSGVGIASGTVQTGATTASLRFVIYNANATSGLVNIYYDDFYLGPQYAMNGAPVTDWVAYTPTFTGLGTVAASTVFSRRVGDTLEVAGRVTAGTSTATPGLIGVGFNGVNGNVVVDTAKMGANNVCGYGWVNTSSATTFGWTILAPASNLSNVVIGLQSSTVTGTNQATNASTSIGTGNILEFNFTVPIVGWSSNVSMSSDADTRVVAFKATNTAGTSISNSVDTTVPFATTAYDTHGAWNGTDTYTVPVSGKYRVTATLLYSGSVYAVADVWYIALYKNGSVDTIGPEGTAGNTTASSMGSMIATTVNCNAGDTLIIKAKNGRTAGATTLNTTAGVNHVEIERLSGPSVIAATESVNARYYACATSISGSLATLSWTTKDFDSHNAMSSGTYTIPVSGKYQVSVAVAFSAASAAAGNALDVQIQKNGSVVSEVAPVYQSTQVTCPVTLDDTISCLAGDTIRVQASSAATTPALTASNSKNFFSIARVGN
jgi:hypothetical protein